MLLASLLVATLNVACPPNLANAILPAPGGAQLITVEAATARSTHATLRTWNRAANGCWTAAAGPFPARVGYSGVRRDRREGDGTTPIGTFRIGATMYGIAPNPGVRYRYQRIRCGDWWVEDPRSPWYNSFRRVPCGQKPPFRTTTGDMSTETRAFAHLAVIEFNMRPVVPGRGSGIFLHVGTGGPTAGCVSLRRDHLVHVLRWLRPGAQPRITIGTTAGLRARG